MTERERERKKKYRQDHIAIGLCSVCPRKVYKTNFCRMHHRRNIIRSRTYQIRQIEQGLCREGCRRPIYLSGLCAIHYMCEAIKKRNHYRIKHGLPPTYYPPKPHKPKEKQL